MNKFQLWLIYCAYYQKNRITPPNYKDFCDGKTTEFVNYGANI